MNKNHVKEVESKEKSKLEIIEGATYIDGILIVNKSYPLPKEFVPKNTYQTITNETGMCPLCIDINAYNAFETMKKDAEKENLKLWIQSGYRTYSYQENIYNKYVEIDGKENADIYSSRPGYSEHHTGLSFDINVVNDSFIDTDEGKWVNDNAYKYGFIIRYPKGKEKYTGYKYEPWHLRYVGKDLAEKLYNDGDWISLEEYFDIESKYKD